MPLDMDGIKKKKKRQGGSGWSPDDGANEVRVLPPTSEYFTGNIAFIAIEYYCHYFRQEGYDTVVSRCLKDDHRYCPACEQVSKFKVWDDDVTPEDPALAKLADDVSRAHKYAFNILDLEDPDAGIQPYLGPVSVHKDLINFLSNKKWGDFLDPAEGRDVTITRTPGSRNTWPSYSCQPDPDITDRTDLLPPDWKDQLDELEYALPDYMKTEEMIRVLDRMGFPVESKAVEEPAQSRQETPEPQAPTETPDETPEPEESEEDDPEPEPEPEPEPSEAPSSASESPTRAALERAKDPDKVIDPPASDESQTPYCFGEYDPDKYPCGDCAVKKDCQYEMLGMGDD